jgi:hypothetical protein
MALPTTARSSPFVSGSFQSSATAAGSGPGSIWTDAAAATVRAVELDGPAIYNIVDDEPAPVRDWLPVLAAAVGAKPPRRLPVWLARLLAGKVVVVMSTEARGASNAKAKRELGWTPRYPSWRRGFPAVYSTIGVADRPDLKPHG